MTGGRATPTATWMGKAFAGEKLTLERANHRVLWRCSEAAVGAWPLVAANSKL
jgi:hypothetical protein